ncbi:lysine--tRNA ligase, partial [Candidatus Woesearchaeota archaeon]
MTEQEETNRLVEERKRKLAELRERGITGYAYKFVKTHDSIGVKEAFEKDPASVSKVKVAGRIMALRRMGKVTFSHIQDEKGKIQIYFAKDNLGESYKLLKKMDIGDIVGVEGSVFSTKTGETTVNVEKFEILTKSLRPLPEKFHGLKDPELRYRERYVDLTVNPHVREIFITRSRIIEAIREFLLKEGYLEVETPILQPIYGGAAAKPFITYHNALKMNLYLRISNELYLKRLLVGGFEKVFEFCRDFRNEGIDTTHNPEFTQMETMTAYADYEDSAKLLERMLEHVAKKLGKLELEYQGKKISLKAPFRRIKMVDAIKEKTGIDVMKWKSVEEARKDAEKLGLKIDDSMGVGAIIAEISSELVEPELEQPTILMDYP